LIRREHQLPFKGVIRGRARNLDQAEPPLALRVFRRAGRERLKALPPLGRRDERDRLPGRRIRAKVAGTPQRSLPLISAALLHPVRNAGGPFFIERQRRAFAVKHQAQHRQIRP
jgi:hypothetical protein